MKRLSVDLYHKIPTFNFWLEYFFYGKFYPVIVGLVALISYVSGFPYFALTVFVIFACACLLLFKDLTPFLILPMAVLIIFRNFSAVLHPYCIVLYCLVAICLITHFIIYPVGRVRGKLFLPFLAITCALFLGGIGSPYIKDYLNGLVFAFAIGPFLLFVYFLFSAYINPPKTFDLKSYFGYIITVLAICISIEVLLHNYYSSHIPPNVLIGDIGWANVNGVASILLLSIPVCWYKVAKSKYSNVYLFTLTFIYVGLYFTESDGCLGIAGALTPFLAIFTILQYKGIKRTKLCLKLLSALFVLCVGLLIITIITRGAFIDNIIEGITSDHGRLEFYNEAIYLFFNFPVFGVGGGYVNPEIAWGVDLLHSYNFHSTLFHVCATMGLVGIIAYAYYFAKRFSIFGAKNHAFNLFTLTGFTAFELYGLIDACEFTVMPEMFILTILIVIVEITNKRGYEKSLPLKNMVKLSSIYNVSGN